MNTGVRYSRIFALLLSFACIHVELREQLYRLEEEIENACMSGGRTRSDIKLLAISKTHSSDVVEEAFSLGLRDFGENRVQELIKKRDLLSTSIKWHLVGHLQSNKAKYIAPFIHLVHSIDSLETAIELSNRAVQNDRAIDVLIEVNIAKEPSKHGVMAHEAERLLEGILRDAPNLHPKGLMTVAPFEDSPEHTRPYFRALRKLRDDLAKKHNHLTFRELSMGMTNDFDVAIEEGATIIRIGSGLFGERE
ncbi:MAG TPA: YggS family pyridoxal phosphate-dependent enzyme [Candidatus Kapabacteria bacterium]